MIEIPALYFWGLISISILSALALGIFYGIYIKTINR